MHTAYPIKYRKYDWLVLSNGIKHYIVTSIVSNILLKKKITVIIIVLIFNGIRL